MAKIVKLTRNSYDDVENIWINADLVRALIPTGDGGTRIEFAKDHSLTVNLAPEDVAKAIQ